MWGVIGGQSFFRRHCPAACEVNQLLATAGIKIGCDYVIQESERL
jgi:hypothetical protein